MLGRNLDNIRQRCRPRAELELTFPVKPLTTNVGSIIGPEEGNSFLSAARATDAPIENCIVAHHLDILNRNVYNRVVSRPHQSRLLARYQ